MLLKKKSTKELVQGEPEVKKEKPPKRWKVGKGVQKEEEKREKYSSDRSLFFRTKAFWGVVSLLLGLVVAFAGVPMLQSAVAETEQTLCFAQNVKAGTKVTEDLLEKKDMSLYHLPAGAIHDPQAAIGQYVKTDAVSGDIVTNMRLSSEYPGADPQLAKIPEGMSAISIALPNLSQSVSGKLRQGDVIQLYAVEDSNSFVAVAPPELHYVEVAAVSYVDGSDVQDDAPDSADGETAKDTLTTVTLLANGTQAACLAGLDHNATLHAALVVRGDDAAKAAALDAQNEYFASLESSDESQPEAEDATPTGGAAGTGSQVNG